MNYIKKSLTLCGKVINIILANLLTNRFNINSLLRIKFFRIITSLNPLLIIILNFSCNTLLNNSLNLSTNSRVLSHYNFRIISTNNKIMRIFSIFSNISANYSFHQIIITHCSRKTSIFFFSSVIRIKNLFIKFIRNFTIKNSISSFCFSNISTTIALCNNPIYTISIPIGFFLTCIRNTLKRKIIILKCCSHTYSIL